MIEFMAVLGGLVVVCVLLELIHHGREAREQKRRERQRGLEDWKGR